MEVFLRNETDEPIHVDINTIQLEVQLRKEADRRLTGCLPEDVAP